MPAPPPDPASMPSGDTVSSRRGFLRSAVGAGLAAAGAGLLAAPAQADPATDAIVKILTVARTAEQLAVTFYTNGVQNAAALGLSSEQTDYLKAALIEEQIHQLFFTANGGQSLADTFSFPDGASTFTDLTKFIKAQQQLEGAFDSAFLSAVKEFADPPISNPALSQIAAQIAMVESEHRALGRLIAQNDPPDNWAFAPVLLKSVSDAPGVLMAAGYLSPTTGNSFMYHQVDFTDPNLSGIYQQIVHLTPVQGDANSDGVVDVGDAIVALEDEIGLRTPSAAEKVAADFNGDGVIDMADVVAILRRAIGL